MLEQAKAKQLQIEQIISTTQEKNQQQIAVKRKAEKLIRTSLNRSVSEFQGWLYLAKLLTDYQASLAISLQQVEFDQWLAEFQSEITNYQKSINKWVMQGCEFFQHSDPKLLKINVPPAPIIQISECSQKNNSSSFDKDTTVNRAHLPRELDLMLKSKVGGVVLGGASYVLNKVSPNSNSLTDKPPSQSSTISSQVYADAAAEYLKTFSDLANATLTEYGQVVERYITFEVAENQNQATKASHQLQLLKNLIDNFTNELDNCEQSLTDTSRITSH